MNNDLQLPTFHKTKVEVKMSNWNQLQIRHVYKILPLFSSNII